jgi:tetratricopeptide (TPR) repeat protein
MRILTGMLIAAALAAGCASPKERSRTWFTYQVAGETATLHARYEKAEDLLGRARAEAISPEELARTHRGYARLARDLGDLPRARAELDQAEAAAATLPADAPERVRIDLEAAWIELAGGSAAAAAVRFGDVDARALSVFGEADPVSGWAAAGRGEAFRRAGDPAAARTELAAAIVRFTGTASADHVKPAEPLGLVAAQTSLARVERAAGELEAARTSLRDAGVLAGEEVGTDHPRLAEVLIELAEVELALGDATAAQRAADRAVAIANARLPADHPIRAAALLAQQRAAEATR